MNNDKAIPILEKTIECMTCMDADSCVGKLCSDCEYFLKDRGEVIDTFKYALDALKNPDTPDLTKIVNEAIHGTIDELCSIGDESHFNYRSYIAGVSALSDYILND